MKKYINKIIWYGCFAICLGLVSCEDYLDKSFESTVSSEDAFKNFTNFQGFTEELYYCIPDFAKTYWQNSFNWGEEEIISTGVNWYIGYKVDNGDFWGWQREHDGWGSSWMDGNINTWEDSRFSKRLWPAAWYGIRKANLGIQNLDQLTDATDEERDLIAGQLYFFRGWFHFMLMKYVGGLPYIDEVLPSDQKLTNPRMNYQQTADRAAEDFQKAVELLPIDWDDTSVGKNTLGKNQQRINKIMALGYLGKNYLYAGSPLMNLESTNDRSYDSEYCKKAADVFAQLLELCESGQSNYELVDFSDYSSIFYTLNQGMQIPGSTEAIFQSPAYDPWATRWGLNLQWAPGVLIGGSSVVYSPTANYASYYGMANGLPISDIEASDTESGYDPKYPFKDRDPRFYHDIVFDGVKCVQGSMPADASGNRYANLYSGGNYRGESSGSRTGYLLRKFTPNTVNNYDFGQDQSHHIHLSYLRLADVYLMYAEAAANSSYGLTGMPSGYSKNAIQAVDEIRMRAGVDGVAPKFTGSVDAFMSEVRRERAVELAYEGHRFNDLRRWLLLDKRPYTLKTSHEFDRDASYNTDNDPALNKVNNLTEVVILERNFSTKHYWLPLKNADVTLYLEFPQNPGW